MGVETDEEPFKEVHMTKGTYEKRQVEMATQLSMDDLIAQLVGVGPSSRVSKVATVATTTTVPTTMAQSEKAGNTTDSGKVPETSSTQADQRD